MLLLLLSLPASTSIGSGIGCASGGTAPGLVVMALKWENTARKATKQKASV